MTGVLVVDDDPAIRRGLDRGLRAHGFQVRLAADGHDALTALLDQPVDCIVLDVRLPPPDGLEVCRRVREAGDDTPILLLTADDNVNLRVNGLHAGADDCLVKPFALEELVARVRALLRRRHPNAERSMLRCGDLSLDRATLEVVRAGQRVDLTPREFQLLEVLLRQPGRVFSREELLALVWDVGFDPNTKIVEVYISYLRRKLEAGGRARLIHTVWGTGYTLRAD